MTSLKQTSTCLASRTVVRSPKIPLHSTGSFSAPGLSPKEPEYQSSPKRTSIVPTPDHLPASEPVPRTSLSTKTPGTEKPQPTARTHVPSPAHGFGCYWAVPGGEICWFLGPGSGSAPSPIPPPTLSLSGWDCASPPLEVNTPTVSSLPHAARARLESTLAIRCTGHRETSWSMSASVRCSRASE
jgi:hypothetical protein